MLSALLKFARKFRDYNKLHNYRVYGKIDMYALHNMSCYIKANLFKILMSNLRTLEVRVYLEGFDEGRFAITQIYASVFI